MREDSDCSLYLAAVCAAVMSWIALSASCVREQPHPSRAPPRGPSSPAGSGQAWPWVRAYRNLRRWVESVPVPGVQRPLPPAPLPLCVTGRRREPTAGRQERSVCVRSCLRGAPGGGDRWEQWSPSLDPSIKGGGKCPLSTSLAHLPGAIPLPSGWQPHKAWGTKTETGWLPPGEENLFSDSALTSPSCPALSGPLGTQDIVDEPEIHSVKLQDRC